MKDRIIKFLTSEGLTATKFADEIGVQRSSISHILSGRNNPSFEFIQKILNRYRNLSAEWLIQGIGPIYKKSDPPSAAPPFNAVVPKTDTTNNQLNLFKQSDESHKTPVIALESKIEPPRKVEKILLFYTDKTFDEFLPPK